MDDPELSAVDRHRGTRSEWSRAYPFREVELPDNARDQTPAVRRVDIHDETLETYPAVRERLEHRSLVQLRVIPRENAAPVAGGQNVPDGGFSCGTKRPSPLFRILRIAQLEEEQRVNLVQRRTAQVK